MTISKLTDKVSLFEGFLVDVIFPFGLLAATRSATSNPLFNGGKEAAWTAGLDFTEIVNMLQGSASKTEAIPYEAPLNVLFVCTIHAQADPSCALRLGLSTSWTVSCPQSHRRFWHATIHILDFCPDRIAGVTNFGQSPNWERSLHDIQRRLLR